MRILAALLLVAVVSAQTILVVGDEHGDNPAHRAVIDRALRNRPTLALCTAGDQTDNGTMSEWLDYYSIENAIHHVAYCPSMGNHDAHDRAAWRRMVRPEYWAVKRFGCVSVYNMDATSSRGYGEQYDWFLENQLIDSARGVPVSLVFWHYPLVSSVTGGDALTLDTYEPLFHRFNVRAVFTGHSHHYEHNKLNGIHYFIVGTGGGWLPDSIGWNPPDSSLVYREAGRYSFVRVMLEGSVIKTCGIRVDGSQFDETTIPLPVRCATRRVAER